MLDMAGLAGFERTVATERDPAAWRVRDRGHGGRRAGRPRCRGAACPRARRDGAGWPGTATTSRSSTGAVPHRRRDRDDAGSSTTASTCRCSRPSTCSGTRRAGRPCAATTPATPCLPASRVWASSSRADPEGEPRLGSTSRLHRRRAGAGEPRGGGTHGRAARGLRGRPRADGRQRLRRAARRRLQPALDHERRRGGGLPRDADPDSPEPRPTW